MSILRALAVIAVAAWLGTMAFFSFVAAPTLFRTAERAAAGQVVGALLPAYYGVGLALSGLACLALLVSARTRGRRLRHLTGAALAAAMVALLAWSYGVTLPETRAARGAEDRTEFARSHRIAVQLNVAAMLCGAALLVIEAFGRERRRDE